MERNWDIIRLLLMQIEKSSPEIESNLSKYDEENIKYNAKLLIESGYMEGKLIKTLGQYESGVATVMMQNLTMEGHDLLDSMRKPQIWEKMKETAMNKGIDITFDTVKMLFSFVTQSLLS